jgi:DHA1 family tetracycline resistance protein-like MFS transporter
MRKSPLIPIFLIVFVDILGLTIILPLLPFYAERLGASPFVVGLLVSIYAFCQLIAGPILGRISDRVGRKPVLLVSQLGTFIGFLILAFSGSLFWIFLARIVDGLTAGNITVAQAYISDVTEPKNRARAFGIIGVSFGLGFLIGPAISGYMAQFGYHYPILAAAGLSLLSIIATSTLLPKDSRSEKHVPFKESSWTIYFRMLKQADLTPLLLQYFLFCLSFSLFVSGFALFSERRFIYQGRPFGPKEVGYIFAYSGAIGVIIQGGLMGKLIRFLGERKLIWIGFTASVISFGLLGESTALAILIIAISFSSFGSGVLRPSITSLITQSAERSMQGLVLGLMQALLSVAQIIAPMISGLLIEAQWLSSWAWTGGAIALLALSVSFLKLGRPKASVPLKSGSSL